MVSFVPLIFKLSQWVKLSPDDIIAKMFLLSLVSHDDDIICKYVPNTKNEWARNTEGCICVFQKCGILPGLKEMETTRLQS